MSELPLVELEELGFTPFFQQQLQASPLEGEVGRISCERRIEYDVTTTSGTLRASLRGRVAHRLNDDERPTVGDWVVVEPAEPVGRIARVLERQNVLRRAVVDGSSRAQNLAANVDLCCVVCALSNADEHARRHALNPRRIERYLATADACRIPARVLVNKADVLPAEEAEAAVAKLTSELPGAVIILTSARTGQGLEELGRDLAPGRSAVLLGSSGVGKSTLVNTLLGQELQRTSPERADDARGRHTTTERQLRRLAGGALLIDTPGMRELALWADADTEVESFPDIEALAAACRFRDCKHAAEPGCAVQAAVKAGTLPAERLAQAHKLEREREQQLGRVNARLQQTQAAKNKASTRALREVQRLKGKS